MMLCKERASVMEGRVEGGRIDEMKETSEEGSKRGMDGARERGEGGNEWRRGCASMGGSMRARAGGKRQGRYSQTNHSQTGPCP